MSEGMTRYVLGIDSGGTKYLVRAAAPDGRILAEVRGAPCSHYQLGEEEATRRIAAHLAACVRQFGGRPEDCLYLMCGTTGYDSPEDGELLHQLYRELVPCPVRVVNDVELAFLVTCGSSGLVTLAGTGSICYGRGPDGREMRLGGWPRAVFGDEGSGRYIDALALRHYSRWLDGSRPESAFLREIRERTGIVTRKELMDYAVRMDTEGITPGLGAAVTGAAEAGDPWAGAILEDAAACLARLAEEAAGCLGFAPGDALRAGIWGSVLINAAPLRESFFRRLWETFPLAVPCMPEKDAVQGAVDLALEALTH